MLFGARTRWDRTRTSAAIFDIVLYIILPLSHCCSYSICIAVFCMYLRAWSSRLMGLCPASAAPPRVLDGCYPLDPFRRLPVGRVNAHGVMDKQFCGGLEEPHACRIFLAVGAEQRRQYGDALGMSAAGAPTALGTRYVTTRLKMSERRRRYIDVSPSPSCEAVPLAVGAS